MSDLLVQLGALGLLILGCGLGYWRWLRPRWSSLDLQGRGLMILVILTLMGGFIGAPIWFTDDIRSFAWDLPPLASRMLAAAGWSFAVVTFLALERPTVRRVRLTLLMLAVYLAPLVVAIFLFHLDRFNFGNTLTYGFFTIAGGMTVAGLWYLYRQPVLQPAPRDTTLPPAPLIQTWLKIVAVVTSLWGLALFATDNGPSDLIWVWPGDLLTSRLIGVMLLTIAVGAWYSWRDADTSRVMLWVTLAYGLGLAVASFWNTLSGHPIRLSYLVVFGLIFLVSTACLALKFFQPAGDDISPVSIT